MLLQGIILLEDVFVVYSLGDAIWFLLPRAWVDDFPARRMGQISRQEAPISNDETGETETRHGGVKVTKIQRGHREHRNVFRVKFRNVFAYRVGRESLQFVDEEK